jgi:hypothetical protein
VADAALECGDLSPLFLTTTMVAREKSAGSVLWPNVRVDRATAHRSPFHLVEFPNLLIVLRFGAQEFAGNSAYFPSGLLGFFAFNHFSL